MLFFWFIYLIIGFTLGFAIWDESSGMSEDISRMIWFSIFWIYYVVIVSLYD